MSDYSKQDAQELHKLVSERQEAIRAFRHASAGTRSRNTREGRNLRREVARIKTELRSRELSAKK